MAKTKTEESPKEVDASSSAEANSKETSVKRVNTKKSANKVSKAKSSVKAKAKTPRKKVDKATEPRIKNPAVAEMVTNALNTLKNRQGVPLAGIKKFIAKTYGLEMTKARQTLIRKAMAAEFTEGRIRMTNDEKETIDFSKRFSVNKKVNQE